MREGKREATFARFAEDYNALQKKNLGVFGNDISRFARYKVAVAKRLLASEPEALLEFGCGIGRNIPFLRDAFPSTRLEACDISEVSLRIAAAHEPDAAYSLVSCPEGIRECYPQGVDCIFISGVLHHMKIAEHPKWLAALYDRLLPGGTMIVFEHNPYNPLTRHFFNTCPYDADANLLSARYVKRLLQQQGLMSIKGIYTLFFPWRRDFWVAFEHLFRHVPLGGQYCVYGKK